MTFDAVGFFDPALKILYKSGSSYCDMNMIGSASQISFKKQGQKPEKKNFYFLQSWCPIWSCLPCSEKNKDQLVISHVSTMRMNRYCVPRVSQYKGQLKFIYSEKATKFWEIFHLLLTVCTVVQAKVLQNLVTFSEYINLYFKMYLLVSSILPKNERKNSTLLLWYLTSIVFFRFLENWRHQKYIS